MEHIIGIDVGGTHADGVLLAGNELLAKKKVQVDQENLSGSIISLLHTLVAKAPSTLARIQLSTTLCTNAIVNDEFDEVGMLIQAGPGMNPGFLNCGEHVCFLDGAIDHRGHIIKDPDNCKIKEAADRFLQDDIKSIGIVTKFSHRNNRHEQEIHDSLVASFPHLSMGHRISGLPNFPRRVYSTWLNAALKSRFLGFQEAIYKGLKQLNITCPCYILKADGGTMPFEFAGHYPCESVHSGPSASVMGCLALNGNSHDTLLMDIGGTTTDLAILADGVPLLEPYGVTVKGRPTLIKALNTRSVGLGGDSAVTYVDQKFIIGPQKKGPPMVLGGTVPTPTDAMVVLGTLNIGAKARAEEAMHQLISGQNPQQTAAQLLDAFTTQIKTAVAQMIEEVFSRPVYTVSALLERKRLEPQELIIVGGPAEAMQNKISQALDMVCTVPPHFEVANAIGAARTRQTMQATLYADTSRGNLTIPEIGYCEKIRNNYDMQDAEDRLTKVIAAMANDFGMEKMPEIDFLERQEMNTMSGFQATGKIISLKAQIKPGLEEWWGEL